MSNNGDALCPTFVLKHAAQSDLGMRRSNNQDSLAVVVTDDLATWATRGHLLIVADGMGAHAAGELASKLAVDNISHNYFKLRDLLPPAAIRQAIRDANNAIHSKGQSSIGFQGMGTTCSCLVLLPQGALIAHIGDSRIYRLRGDLLEQLTFDHSLVWEMAAAGQMAECDVPSYIPKNVITRSLGPHPTVQVDVEGPYDTRMGDTFLLCSDGLSGPISDEEMGTIARCMPPSEAAETLIDLANLRGGPDNISVVVAQVNGNVPINIPTEGVVDHSSQNGGLLTALLLGAGACLAALGYCVFHELWIGALASGLGFVGTSIAALASKSGSKYECPPIGSIGGPYGNGPYRKAQCAPSPKMVGTLSDIADKLRNLPNNSVQDSKVDWASFDATRAEGKAAADKGDFAAAVQKYSAAIRRIMKQLREHRPTIDAPSDRF